MNERLLPPVVRICPSRKATTIAWVRTLMAGAESGKAGVSESRLGDGRGRAIWDGEGIWRGSVWEAEGVYKMSFRRRQMSGAGLPSRVWSAPKRGTLYPPPSFRIPPPPRLSPITGDGLFFCPPPSRESFRFSGWAVLYLFIVIFFFFNPF